MQVYHWYTLLFLQFFKNVAINLVIVPKIAIQYNYPFSPENIKKNKGPPFLVKEGTALVLSKFKGMLGREFEFCFMF